jgi:hypothetical protein
VGTGSREENASKQESGTRSELKLGRFKLDFRPPKHDIGPSNPTIQRIKDDFEKGVA